MIVRHNTGMVKRPAPIIAIDLLRLLCAAMVMLHHFFTTSALHQSPAMLALLDDGPAPPSAMVSAMRFNWIGVQIFFVISGIVIAESARGTSQLDFIKRRILRLLPTAFVCASLTAVVLSISGLANADLIARWAASASLWPFLPQIDPSYWTLGVELVFYLSVAAALGPGRTWRPEGFATILLALGGVFWVAILAAGAIFSIGYIERGFTLTMLPFACFFALGMIIAVSAREGWSRPRMIKASAATVVCVAEIIRFEYERSGVFETTATPIVPIALFLIGIALLIAAWRLQPHLERHIRPEVARIAGLVTYPLYLIHQEVGTAINSGLTGLGFGYWTGALGATLASLLAAGAVVAYLEPPVRRGLRSAMESRAWRRAMSIR